MVSGFLTSPCDHSRIFSGDASEIRIALNESGSLGFSKKLKMSRIGVPFSNRTSENEFLRGSAEWACSQHALSLLLGGLVGGAELSRLEELDVQAECLEL